MPAIRVCHLIPEVPPRDHQGGDGRGLHPGPEPYGHLIVTLQHAHGRRPWVGVEQGLLALARMNPVQVDAEALPGCPQSFDSRGMVVDQHAVPIAFGSEQLGKSLLDLKKHIKHNTPPREPAEPFLSSDSLPSRPSSLAPA